MEELTVEALSAAGFVEVGCWSASETRLNPPRDLPAQRGVYAFAIEERIVYVGLASRSVKQRLGFYASPGSSQKTNVRLNAMIRELIGQGKTVRILLAHPQDGTWNGLRVSGSEGLEAALIEDHDLPWNMRGSTSPVTPAPAGVNTPVRRRGGTAEAVKEFVAAHPHCTELQIARGLFGPNAVQPRVNPYCRKLVEGGEIERLPTSPATYLVKR